MGDSKTLTKFRRLLEECEEGHFFKGTISEFDVVDYVPKERHTKGMFVDSGSETKLVEFYSGSKKYIEDLSHLSIGEEVLILGKNNPLRPKNTLPNIIIVPRTNVVLLSREQERFRFEGRIDYATLTSCVFAGFFAVISYLTADIPLLFLGVFYPYWELTLWSSIISIFFFVLFLTLIVYKPYTRRGLVVKGNSETWKILIDEISGRFSEIALT
ncbi:MAG: hypothetical protein ACFFE3_07490 [Candidatus Thorarchaeota archaeon]